MPFFPLGKFTSKGMVLPGLISVWMAFITTRISLILMMRVGVTNYAVEYRKIARRGMAIHALIPFVFMLARINREILLVVVETRGLPGGF